MSRLVVATLYILLMAAFCPSLSFSHPGGLDSDGCHTNRKTGEYHCHRAGKKSSPPNTSPNGAVPATNSSLNVPQEPAEQKQLMAIAPDKGFSHGIQSVPVVGVVDGDTIKVMLNGAETSIRLHGIDAPESGQDYGQSATQILKMLNTGRSVSIKILDRDRYGRSVALVNTDGASVNEALLTSGYAWVYPKYCTQSYCKQWNSLQGKAKDAGAGLWKDKNPTPPWEWRNGSAPVTGYQIQRLVETETEGKQAKTDANFSGNVSSKKFHRPGCRHHNCSNCVATFASRDQALAAGYSPCGICRP